MAPVGVKPDILSGKPPKLAPAQLAPLPCLSKGGAIAVLHRGASPRLRANTFDRGHGSLDDSFWGPRLGCLRCENHNPVRRGNRIRWGAGKQRPGITSVRSGQCGLGPPGSGEYR
ncbi:hypothetical protein NDU88_004605 [Pleurodeles waltl]|uniref:Uncharacterized protein n=1 Tax=Pleurodeles waltl TaxID=8319 RepID=A0AAV7PG76_PLEWA|nr:hypothetical protein NDU88_004605 [Pleurodeles waltl]